MKLVALNGDSVIEANIFFIGRRVIFAAVLQGENGGIAVCNEDDRLLVFC